MIAFNNFHSIPMLLNFCQYMLSSIINPDSSTSLIRSSLIIMKSIVLSSVLSFVTLFRVITPLHCVKEFPMIHRCFIFQTQNLFWPNFFWPTISLGPKAFRHKSFCGPFFTPINFGTQNFFGPDISLGLGDCHCTGD